MPILPAEEQFITAPNASGFVFLLLIDAGHVGEAVVVNEKKKKRLWVTTITLFYLATLYLLYLLQSIVLYSPS